MPNIIWSPSPNYSYRTSSVTAIVLHWWDDPAKRPSLSGTVSWLKNPSAQVSAHFVVSDTSIYQLVSEDHAAWHAGPANPSTIGIEVDPQFPGRTYETLIWLCRDIATRRRIPASAIKGHRDYMNTACPGTLDINRVRAAVSSPSSGEQEMTEEQFQVRALTEYQQAREKAGMSYPGGARQFAIDRVLGGTTFKGVMNADMAHYIAKEAVANQQSAAPAPISAQDSKDLELGRKFRSVSKEANAA